MAPLGLPVVPPVYCSSATSSTSTLGHCRGSFLAPAARSSSKRITGASGAIGAVGMAEGPNAVSSPTIRWSTSPSAFSFCASRPMKPMLEVTSTRAPESFSL